MKIIVSILLFTISTSLYPRSTYPKLMTDYIRSLDLKPLSKVDTLSKNLPANIITSSHWHLEYYARFTQNDGPAQLDVYEMVYNDTIFCSTWKPYNTLKKIEYDYLELKDESDKFLYFGIRDSSIEKYFFVVSKTINNRWFQFSDILFKDLTNGIFLEYSLENCQESENPLVLNATNINTGKVERLKLDGYCTDLKSCLNTVSYTNGELTLEASLIKKRKKKCTIQIKKIKI